jgi:hypothetical protein
MSNPFKLCFTLRQHTPIIHFQHEQEGATLRASEVKPKLDRFIIEKCKTQKIEYKKWLKVKEDKESLDYKLRINAVIDETFKFLIASRFSENHKNVLNNHNIPFIAPSPYFAQESDYKNLIKKQKKDRTTKLNVPDTRKESVKENISKYGIINDLNHEFEAVFTSYHFDLIDKMADWFPEFLAVENFGTRQSKGFGCFTVSEKKDKTEYSQTDFENHLKDNFKFVYRKEIPYEYTDNGEIAFDLLMQDIFAEIQYDYQLLKSGIGAIKKNDTNYRKSKLFSYGIGLDIRWEKRKIKQELNNKTLTLGNRTYKLRSNYPPSVNDNLNYNNNKCEDDEIYDYRYLRAVLGLAEQFEFLTTGGGRTDKIIVKVKSKDGIERYRSPILFKVFDKYIYLVGNDVHEGILNEKEFDFLYHIKPKDNSKTEHKPPELIPLTSIKTPKTFDLGKFIKASICDMGYIILKESP